MDVAARRIPLFLLPFVFLSSFFIIHSSKAQVTFRTVTSLNAPDEPYELAKGDLNNDGRVDFVTANFTGVANQQVTVLINAGTGTFTGGNVRNFAASTFLIDVALGDFNEDGNLDVVACSDQNDNFSLLLGDGAGNLAAPVNFAAGDRPTGIAVGDMNKDGNLDVLVSHSGTPDDIYIFAGNGAGGFAAPVILSNPTNTTYDITVADFNLDTNPDFAITTAGVYTVQVWSGNGSGTAFTLAQTIPSMSINPDLDARDLNGDGAMDIVAGPGYIMNNGTGTFGARVILAQSDEEYSTGDLNGDGNIDIVTTDNNVNRANTRVYLGNGAGVFTLLHKTEMRVYARGLELGDVNNDGLLDVVGAGGESSDGRVDVLLGDGAGYFSNSITKYPTSTDPRDMITGDFNEDGQIDVALCHSTLNQVAVYLGNSGGKFTKTATNHATGAFPADIITLDYNKDGHLDLAVHNQTASSITVLTGDGAGSFSLLVTFACVSGAGAQLVSADFNNDTFPDLAISGTTNNQVNFFAGTGSGFGAAVPTSITDNIQYIGPGDFNGDGFIDLVAYLNNINRMVLLTGNGTGTFTQGGTQYPMANANFLVTDINGDAITDVITFSNSGTGSDYFINDGTGTFTGTSVPSSLGGQAYGYADMNGDGLKDLVVGAQNPISSESGQILILRGTGTGFVGTVLIDHDNSGGNRAAVHDVNGDGKMDVIVTSFNIYEDYLGTLINTTVPVGCPAITLHPMTQTTCTGLGVLLTVAATGNAPLSYQWRRGVTNVGTNSPNLVLNPIVAGDAGSYTCVVSNGCGSVTSNAAILTVNTTPSPPVTVPGSRCGPGSVNLQATGASDGDYRWYPNLIDATPIAGATNEFFATPSLTATATYYASILISGCESSRVAAMATVNTPPAQPTISSSVPAVNGVITVCSSTSLTLSAPNGFAGYAWSSGETTPLITPVSSGAYTVTVTDGAGCTSPPSAATTVTIVPAPCINQPPVIVANTLSTTVGSQLDIDLLSLISDPDDNLVVSTFAVVVPPFSGAGATIVNELLTLDYSGVSFAGTDQFTVQACDVFGACTQEVLQVNVIGEIRIFNAVSPNGDGKNDMFIIQSIDALPGTQNNKLTIINRWGTVVFEAVNYDNMTNPFKGVSTGGSELPSGTYYYVLEFSGGAPKQTGFISLRR